MQNYLSCISADLLSILMQLFLLFLLQRSHSLPKAINRVYWLATVLILCTTVTEPITYYFLCFPASCFRTPYALLKVLSYVSPPFIMMLVAMSFGTCTQFGHRCMLSLAVGNAAIGLLSLGTGWYFSISPQGVYQRGPLYQLFVIIILIFIVLLTVYNQRTFRTYDAPEQHCLMALCAVLAIAMAMRAFLPKVIIIWGCATIGMLLYYVFLREMTFKYDPTTHLRNRISYDNHLQDLENGSACAYMVMLDVNNLKKINDTLGHAAGDQFLQTVASNILDSFHTVGTAFRIGGDEFCIVCENCGSESIIRACLQRLNHGCQKMSKHYAFPCYIAHGYALYNPEDSDLEAVLKCADQRMYADKLRSKTNRDAQ